MELRISDFFVVVLMLANSTVSLCVSIYICIYILICLFTTCYCIYTDKYLRTQRQATTFIEDDNTHSTPYNRQYNRLIV